MGEFGRQRAFYLFVKVSLTIVLKLPESHFLREELPLSEQRTPEDAMWPVYIDCPRNSIQWCIQNVPASKDWEHWTIHKATGSWGKWNGLRGLWQFTRASNSDSLSTLIGLSVRPLQLWAVDTPAVSSCERPRRLRTGAYFLWRLSRPCLIYYHGLSWYSRALHALFSFYTFLEVS